ncbi:MAG: hypothetical protein NT159_08230 [Proteobacteria bacterium]|nr:hypothetical protein [Pseudomonadota bacterium]
MTPFRQNDGMPVGQCNANLPAGLQMRVGIPHKGGRLAFHAFERGYPAMVSANAFWNPAKGQFLMPEATDLTECDFALDSAGFMAMRLWQAKGMQPGMAGIFPWSYSQYVDFASQSGAAWYTQPDLCCEPEIAGRQDVVDYRVNATATLLEGTLRMVYGWQEQLAASCNARTIVNMLPPPVPVLQGWSASDYLRSLDLMMQVWERWQPWLAPPILIGVGSVCRRSLTHPTHGLYAILAALEGKLPKGARVHLFGVKGCSLDRLQHLDWVASVDSMAWDFGARMCAVKSGYSNTLARRSEAMTGWMDRAAQQLRQPQHALQL